MSKDPIINHPSNKIIPKEIEFKKPSTNIERLAEKRAIDL
jgi:hypothetical protein